MTSSALRRQRQRDLELGTPADLAHDVHGALVRLDDLPRDRHPETRALLLGGEERIEDAGDLVVRDPAAVVAEADGRPTVAVLDEEVDAPALGYGGERVDR